MGLPPTTAADGDGGANDELNYPVITSVGEAGGTVTIDFDLDVPAGTYRVEGFSNPNGADPSGYGEGAVFEGTTSIVHTGSGTEPFQISFPAALSIYTLTATEDLGAGDFGSTSEFSLAVGSFAPTAVDDPGDVPTEIAARSPLSYFRLGETTGTVVVDAGSAANDGTYVNGVTLGAPGALAGDGHTAADFDGIDDYAEVPHDNTYLIDQGAISLWMQIDNLSSSQSPLSKDSNGSDTGGHFQLEVQTDGRLDLRMQDTSTSYDADSAAGAITAGQWHHVVMTFGARGMELWLDGDLVAANPYTGGLGTSSGGAGNYEPLAIGTGTAGSGDLVATPISREFDGRIDEVAIFGTQLALEDISALYGAALQSYEIGDNQLLSVPTSSGVLVNDSDADGDPLTASLVSGPINAASFTLNADGSFDYTSNPGFHGTDTFTYRANDGVADSAPATVSITVFDASATIVNSTGGTADASPGDNVCDTGGTNAEGSPECTLRAAIAEANASSVVDTIHFDIPISDGGHSGGIWTIPHVAPLVVQTRPVTIDATTQPGWTSTPVIFLDGSGASGGTDGLYFDFEAGTVRGMAIGNYPGDGIHLRSSNGYTIEQNHLGVGPNGTTPAGNGGHGLYLEGADDVTVGGPGVGNVISGNGQRGVYLDFANNVTVDGNLIGVALDGSTARPNVGGIEVRSGNTIAIGGGAGNTISGNTGDGIYTDENTTIQNNRIGTNASGTAAVGNSDNGIELSFASGTQLIDNTISGNGGDGVYSRSSDNLTVQGNRIGTTAAGTAAIGNTGDGLDLEDNSHQIGGTGTGEGNVISGNGGVGISLNWSNNATIEGNAIGTDPSGAVDLGNGNHGLWFLDQAENVRVGGTAVAAANAIAFNTGDGISVSSGNWGHAFSALGNTIHSNGALGIDLGDNGVTTNDTGDADTSAPNDYLNYPLITSAVESAGTVTVSLDLDVPANGDGYRIEFFANPTGADPSGSGEGQTLLGSVDVPGTGTGYVFVYSGSAGDIVTATTIEKSGAGFGDTSEFSAAMTVT